MKKPKKITYKKKWCARKKCPYNESCKKCFGADCAKVKRGKNERV
jgi:hypothetical protein